MKNHKFQMNQAVRKIILAGLVLMLAVTASYFYYRGGFSTEAAIYEFSESRDSQQILELFKTDRYWLVAGDYDEAAMLRLRAPSANPAKAGQMHIKVMREDDQFVGFMAYFKKLDSEWIFNFIAVRKEFRGRGYANKMMFYALDDMTRQGAKLVTLVTRTDNFSAQALYKRVGFKETSKNDQFVNFEYSVP